MDQDTKGLPPLLPGAAAAVAFLLAGSLALGVLNGQIVTVVLALVPLLGGLGILRWRSWSAYGLALFEGAHLLILPWLLLRPASGSVGRGRSLGIAVVQLALIVLFWAAGRSLARVAGPRGRAWPWVVVSAVCTLPWLFLQAFTLPTGSMENTLLIGDRLLVQTFPKPAPHFEEIVVFPYPADRGQTLIKRVIGMPGDRIHLSAKVVYRNGAALTEPYVVHRFPLEDYRDNFPTGVVSFGVGPAGQEMLSKHVVKGDVVVPAGKYFVLGDNRDNSLDSRYWGFLDGADILGKPLMIYQSEVPAEKGTKTTGLQRERWGRLFKAL